MENEGAHNARPFSAAQRAAVLLHPLKFAQSRRVVLRPRDVENRRPLQVPIPSNVEVNASSTRNQFKFPCRTKISILYYLFCLICYLGFEFR